MISCCGFAREISCLGAPGECSSGTSFSESTENTGELSGRRSPERVLLRIGAHSSAGKSRKIVRNGPRGCYDFNPGLLPKGMCLRGGQFYFRRHIPCDVQPLIGRAEVWRSLKTDSLQMALRRLPSVAAGVEAEIEHARLLAGQLIDTTLI